MSLHWVKIKQIIEETPEIKTFLLELPQDFIWEEGAHTHLAMKGFNDGETPNKSLVRHMSISTLPKDNVVGITTRIKKQCSEFKSILKTLTIGDEVALFKIHSNVPLKRENKNIYLLSAGVGIATFRPIVQTYLENQENVKSVTSLNIDTSKQYLFTNIFTSDVEKSFSSKYVDTREAYYDTLQQLAKDPNGIYYVIGSDEFIHQNIQKLFEHGVTRNQIMLDKREQFIEKYFTFETTTI